MTSEPLSIGRLLVNQRQISAGAQLSGRYDLVISSISWETRNATALAAVGGSDVPSLLLRFASGKATTDAAKDANLAKLRLLCPNNEVLVLGPSIDFDSNSELLQTALRDRFVKAGAPLRVLVDITCVPKSYLSFLCGLGFANDYLCRLDCLYAEGHYTLTGTTAPGGPLSIISEGEWSSLQVPYLEANNTFPPQRDLIVILGGEIGYSLPFIERYEPARLGIVFIRDGIEVDKLVGSEKAAYAELTSEPSLVRADFAIDDIVGVLAHVHDFCAADPERSVVGLAIGSKAQSLALALAALDLDNLEVVCRIPGAYSDKDVTPTGRIFLYEIEDRFEPTGYLG